MKGFNKRVILIHMMGAIIARATFYNMNPLAIGYFTAAYLGKAGGALSLITILLGASTAVNQVQLFILVITMITALVIYEFPPVKENKIPKTLLYGVAPILLGCYSVMEAATTGAGSKGMLLAALEGVISLVSAIMFRNGIEFILKSKKGFRMNNEQMVSMAIMVAVIIYGIPNLPLDNIAIVETGVYFTILFFTYKYGVGQGAITGAVCGVALCLRGMPLSDMGIYTIMGIVPAIFRELGRVPTSIIYVTIATICNLIWKETSFTPQEGGALLSSVVIFLLIPKTMVYRVEGTDFVQKELEETIYFRKVANTRMRLFSDTFVKLSKVLDGISEKQMRVKEEQINHIFEDISERLCKHCDQCSNCWDKNFEATYQATCNMFQLIEENGNIDIDDVPLHFMNDCISVDEFIQETRRGFEIAKLNNIWHKRVAENRGVISEQLKEVSTAIKEITSDIYETKQILKVEEDKIKKRLKALSITGKDITVIERVDKRKEVYLTASCRKGNCVTAREVATVISEVMGVRMRPSESSRTVVNDTAEFYGFIEDTKFKVLTGVARAMRESVSGDNFSVLKMENGRVMIALSDGMGTGQAAGEESETVMSLLEQMIESGFRPETAIKLINSNLVLKSDKQTFSTIDLGMLDLFTGVCEFVKIGAASAFIKRENWVETISSTTLPIGMFGNVDYDAVTKKLYPGDIVILLTDGVLDCLQVEDKEAYLEQFIMELKSSNPQEIANSILEHSLKSTNYVPKDDMTIITAGIWIK